MRLPTAGEFLELWERGLERPHHERAQLLLAAACTELSADALLALSIGRRDAQLLTLREWAFGSELLSVATCARCGERLELTFNVADIRAAPAEDSPETLSASLGEREVRFRLPTSLDLSVIAGLENVMDARVALLERCVLETRPPDAPMPVAQWPAELVDAVAARMSQADPQADVRLSMTCPSCYFQWDATFDIVSYLWNELSAWAYRTLGEVHSLAAAYGWREADILALSAWRRQFYLTMVRT